MNTKDKVTISIALLGLFMLSSTSHLAAQEGGRSLMIVSQTALGNALIQLDKALGCTIVFEDAPYKNPEVITELFPGGLRVPVTRNIEFTYSSKGTPAEIIEALLSQYNRQFGDAIFKVTKVVASNNIFHVFPMEWKNAAGRMVKYESPFLIPISFSVQSEDSLPSALQRLLASTTSHYESKIVLNGPIPRQAMRVTADFTNTIAVECLAAIMDKFRASRGGVRISWSLRRGPLVPALGDFAVFSVRQPDLDPVSGDVVINIETEKPLEMAVRLLEKKLNCTISYEDNEYVLERDMFISNNLPQRLKGDSLLYSYSRDWGEDKIIRELVLASKRYGEFDVARVSEHGFAVYPVKTYDENGKLVPVEALSRIRLKQSGDQKSIREMLASVAASLEKASGKKVTSKNLPASLASNTDLFRLPDGSVSESLGPLLQTIDPTLSWHLTYSVKTRSFEMGIHKRDDAIPGVWTGMVGGATSPGTPGLSAERTTAATVE